MLVLPDKQCNGSKRSAMETRREGERSSTYLFVATQQALIIVVGEAASEPQGKILERCDGLLEAERTDGRRSTTGQKGARREQLVPPRAPGGYTTAAIS